MPSTRYVMLAIIFSLATFAAGCAGKKPETAGMSPELWSGPKLRIDDTRGPYRLVVYGYDAELGPWGPDCIKDEGFTAVLFHNASGKSTIIADLGYDGSDNILDYSALSKGVVTLTQCTHDPRSSMKETLMWRDTFTVEVDGRVSDRFELLLKPEKWDDAAVERYTETLKQVTESGNHERMTSYDLEKCEEDFLDCLAHLRNMSGEHPDRIDAIIHEISLRTDGAFSEELDGFIGEVGVIRDVREGKMQSQTLMPFQTEPRQGRE